MARSHFFYYYDPGHSWLCVGHDDIKDVGLSIHAFSKYSYMHKDSIFLEEDCDAGLFLTAYEATFGKKPELTGKGVTGQSRIRSYAHLSGLDYSWDKHRELMAQYRAIIEQAA